MRQYCSLEPHGVHYPLGRAMTAALIVFWLQTNAPSQPSRYAIKHRIHTPHKSHNFASVLNPSNLHKLEMFSILFHTIGMLSHWKCRPMAPHRAPCCICCSSFSIATDYTEQYSTTSRSAIVLPVNSFSCVPEMLFWF